VVKPDRQILFLGTAVAIALIIVAVVLLSQKNGEARNRRQQGESKLAEIPFDGQRAYEFLQKVCALGPRYSGSPGMSQQQQMLLEHFQALGAQVQLQSFDVRHPVHGRPVQLANLIVTWHPQRHQRILLCAHYDTRPYPDRDSDPGKQNEPFIGANDGASGVAVLAEMARYMPTLGGQVGVDFVLFDGEELVYDDRRDEYFLGSGFFSRSYVADPPGHRYRCAVLMDMVGDAELHLFQERNSTRWPDVRPFVDEIWAVAKDLGVREFIPRVRHEVRDDHLKLHDVAGIPALDIIDFDYPRPGLRTSYWHTTEDTPDKCSADSLAKVGWVVLEWLNRSTGS